jgi:hypothetical protein
MSFCKVRGCRFPEIHITKYHCCGKCNQFGHGQTECGNENMIKQLENDTLTIPFDLQCAAQSCTNISTHITDGHKCTYCSLFGHDVYECPSKSWDYIVDCGTTFGRSKDGFLEEQKLKLQARKQFGWNEHKVYTLIYAGMGCSWYARRNNNFENIELFFMHSDNWGQYGPATDDRPKLDKFLEGYRCIDK